MGLTGVGEGDLYTSSSFLEFRSVNSVHSGTQIPSLATMNLDPETMARLRRSSEYLRQLIATAGNEGDEPGVRESGGAGSSGNR